MRFTLHAVRAASLAGAALAMLACGAVAAVPRPVPSLGGLHDRPLKTPSVTAGQACPASPTVSVAANPSTMTGKTAVPGYAFGSGPAYLSGQTSWYADPAGQVAMVVVDTTTYTGPILVRTRRLDGTGTAGLKNVDEQGIVALAGALGTGTVTTDGVEVAVPAPATPGLWSAWFGRLTVDRPGCYALQVDGTSFTSVIVFAVLPGPLPGG
jgi:hypothetical protein